MKKIIVYLFINRKIKNKIIFDVDNKGDKDEKNSDDNRC